MFAPTDSAFDRLLNNLGLDVSDLNQALVDEVRHLLAVYFTSLILGRSREGGKGVACGCASSSALPAGRLVGRGICLCSAHKCSEACDWLIQMLMRGGGGDYKPCKYLCF